MFLSGMLCLVKREDGHVCGERAIGIDMQRGCAVCQAHRPKSAPPRLRVIYAGRIEPALTIGQRSALAGLLERNDRYENSAGGIGVLTTSEKDAILAAIAGTRIETKMENAATAGRS